MTFYDGSKESLNEVQMKDNGCWHLDPNPVIE